MDRISKGLLSEFSSDFNYTDLDEADQFENFSTWLTVRRHYSETTFNPIDLVVGNNGNDTGIDAIAAIVNNNLVTDVDEIDNLISVNNYLDVTFIFVQAERSNHFDMAKIGQFCFGVKDFFGAGKLKRNEAVQQFSDIMNAIYNHSAKFRPNKPNCYLYYVTTGVWKNDQNLRVRADTEVADIKSTNLFDRVEFYPVDATSIQKLYNQSKNTISREFTFDKRTVVPEVNGVKEAYLGFLPAKDFIKLVEDEDGKIIKSLFYENIRDWQGYNDINLEIRETVKTFGDRFIIMNNGVTIIARTLQTTGDKFSMSDFQIVNGCQTSHVLHNNKENLTDSVRVPFRLICTQDESVIESIIRATNRQTDVLDSQFFAMKDFAKKLEVYFKSFPLEYRLYYERRTHQYDSQEVDKPRIISHDNLVRAVGAMFLGQPHITTKDFRALSARVGKEMFLDTDKLEPYYVAAYALYQLQKLFNSRKIPGKYKAARYQILLAARVILYGKPLPPMNSYDIAKKCEPMWRVFWNDEDVEALFNRAVERMENLAGANWTRDSIRTETLTRSIITSGGTT